MTKTPATRDLQGESGHRKSTAWTGPGPQMPAALPSPCRGRGSFLGPRDKAQRPKSDPCTSRSWEAGPSARAALLPRPAWTPASSCLRPALPRASRGSPTVSAATVPMRRGQGPPAETPSPGKATPPAARGHSFTAWCRGHWTHDRCLVIHLLATVPGSHPVSHAAPLPLYHTHGDPQTKK